MHLRDAARQLDCAHGTVLAWINRLDIHTKRLPDGRVLIAPADVARIRDARAANERAVATSEGMRRHHRRRKEQQHG